MTAPNVRASRILLIGGSALAALATSRSLGTAGHEVGRLRWHTPRTIAEASRHCHRAGHLDPWALGVASWCERLVALIGRERFDILLPLDELAHELLAALVERGCDIPRPAMPSPPAYRTAGDRWLTGVAARHSGWRTPKAQLVQHNGDVPSVNWPCVVRPSRMASIVGNEPAVFSVRKVSDAAALDAKLRDDLPRGDVVLQSPAEGQTVDVLLAAIDGRLLGHCALHRGSTMPDALPAPVVEATKALLERLQCTGLLRLECVHNHGEWTLLDLRFGPGDLLHSCGGAGAVLPGTLVEQLAATSIALAARQGAPANRPGRRPDPWPAMAGLACRARDVLDKAVLRARVLAWRESERGMASAALRSRQSILFVCKGNINRSMVAEQVLRAAGVTQVASAGLLDMGGRRASAAAETFIAETLRLPTAALRSRSMNSVMRGGTSFAHVVCFERRHVIELQRRHPELRGRLHLLSAWAGEQGRSPDIPDPHGGTASDYQRCFERIADALRPAVGEPDVHLPRMAVAAP